MFSITILISAASSLNAVLIKEDALIRGKRLIQYGHPKMRRLIEGGAYLRPGVY